MKIQVRTLAQPSMLISVDVPDDGTILQLKQKMIPKYAYDTQSQNFVFKGNQLDNRYKLANIKEGFLVMTNSNDVTQSQRKSIRGKKPGSALPAIMQLYAPSANVHKIIVNSSPLFTLPEHILKKPAAKTPQKSSSITTSGKQKRFLYDPSPMLARKLLKPMLSSRSPLEDPMDISDVESAPDEPYACSCGECHMDEEERSAVDDESEESSSNEPQSDSKVCVVSISRENVDLLISLGFSRERSVRALALANNSVDAAAHILLEGFPRGVTIREADPQHRSMLM